MKFIHLADLHLGKKVFGYDLMEEQKDVLSQVLSAADQYGAECVLISGDVYDTAVPSVEAVGLLDWFLKELHARRLGVYMISGNHDSASRLNFGSELLDSSGVHIVGIYDGSIPYFDLEKAGETPVRLHLLPFIKPGHVRARLNENCIDWSQAAKIALSKTEYRPDGLNFLLSHQFYAGAESCESEQLMVGNLDSISIDVLDGFDYCALGHLHTPQSVKKETIRYPGTLLKFSASELGKDKSITLVETGADRAVTVHEIPVRPLRDLVRIQGTFDELVSRSFLKSQNLDNYFYIVLDDEQEVFQVFDKLSLHYPRILKIEYSRRLEENSLEDLVIEKQEMKSPEEIFSEFYEAQNGRSLDPAMAALLNAMWEETLNEAD